MKEKDPTPRRRTRKPTGGKAHLLGLGLNDDGHKRLTKGEDFTLLGGNKETHEAMTESVVKTTEDLKKKGRTIGSAEPEEVIDLLKKNTPKV